MKRTNSDIFEKLMNRADETEVYEIMEYFAYKVLFYIQEEIDDIDNFIEELESFSERACLKEDIDQNLNKGVEEEILEFKHNLSEFFFTLSLILTLKRDRQAKRELSEAEESGINYWLIDEKDDSKEDFDFSEKSNED